MEFVELLKQKLIIDGNETPAEADRLIKTYPDIVMQGIMKGAFALGTTAMALQMKRGNTPNNGMNGDRESAV